MSDTTHLRNKKIFFLAVNTGFGENNAPDDRLIDFHQQRSGEEIYCSIVGNVVIPNGYGSNDYCLFMSKSSKWQHLSDAINNNNSLAGIQLSSTWENYIGNKKFVSSTSSTAPEDYLSLVKDINKPEIDDIFINLTLATELAIKHGFKHIQIHAGHGYLFSLLLDKVFCQNASYALEKMKALINNISNKVETSIRISLLTGVQKIDKQRNESIHEILELPFDYFDLSFGFYNINKHMIYPESKAMLKSRINNSLNITNTYNNKKFIISGLSLKLFNGTLPHNATIGICRDLIANPNYLVNPQFGCTLCGKCHYYSRGESHISCEQWL